LKTFFPERSGRVRLAGSRLWNPGPVHLLLAERSGHRVIDGERFAVLAGR
jgi:hypothetical protein